MDLIQFRIAFHAAKKSFLTFEYWYFIMKIRSFINLADIYQQKVVFVLYFLSRAFICNLEAVVGVLISLWLGASWLCIWAI